MSKNIHEEFEESLRDVMTSDGKRSSPDHHFHPSEITGCPLKVHLNKMTRHETTLNSWLFQGSAVHHYMQETGILDKALERAGYHPVSTKYERNIKYPLSDDVWINGTCDILVQTEDKKVIYDIKYTSIPIEADHPRIYKYFSQANTYAKMFGADEYGLILINSKSQNLVEDTHVVTSELSDENWEIVTTKAHNIKDALEHTGFITDGEEKEKWEPEWLREKKPEFWKDIASFFNNSHIPSYDGECKYCDHKEYCPEQNGHLGGVNELISGSSNG